MALDAGLSMPGRVLALRPPAGADLAGLAEVHVVHGFRPDHDWFAARGLEVGVAPAGPYGSALVCLPRAKDHARDLIARACRLVGPGATVAVDGLKTDGIESVLRDLRRRLGSVSGPVSKAHGKLFWLASPGALPDWEAAPGEVGGFETAAAGFSARAVDRGSGVLAAALPTRLPGRGADLGAGWGYLAARALEREGVEAIDLVEAEHDALEAARRNVADPRAAFHWADVTRFEPAAPLDWAVANPPFHRGRAADPALGRAFIEAAAGMLAPHGRLWCVANRHLGYERTLAGAFEETSEVAGDAAFKVMLGARPSAAQRRGRTRAA